MSENTGNLLSEKEKLDMLTSERGMPGIWHPEKEKPRTWHLSRESLEFVDNWEGEAW